MATVACSSRFVDHLGLTDAVLLGNSLGGVNAYQFAARHPYRVRGLVIEDIGAEVWDDLSSVLAWEGRFATREALVERVGPRFLPYLRDSAGVGLPRVIGGASVVPITAAPAAAPAALARTMPGVAVNNMSDAARLATAALAPAASTPHHGNLYVVKECTGYSGDAGGYCTVTSSNIPAIKVGSRIVYGQAAGETALNSDIVLTSGAGNRAIGHCYPGFADGLGLCTIAGGTGTFAGFEASVTVTASATVDKGWDWDGTYSVDKTK